jgi:2-desacetyl-2-hydroxyethyl bacteriochlorophyllide A dehydrogenase
VKAVVQRGFGGPEVLEVVELPDPEPGPLDVVVRVRACATNRLDVVQRAGWFTLPGFALPHVPGLDIAGEVAAVGSSVSAVAVGDVVVVDPSMVGVPAGAAYAGAVDPYGDLDIIGATVPGGYAELCLAPASHVHRLPGGADVEAAATVPTAYATAYHALFATGRLQAGETLLVHAAGSGLSSAAIQLAVHAGATVLATSSAGKTSWATSLGAADACDNRTVDVASWAMDRTDGRGVDMVFDHVGPALWDASLRSLRPRGRVVFCGNTTGDEVRFSLGAAYHRGIAMLGSDAYSPDELGAVLALVAGGSLRSIVTERYDLAEVAEAHRRLEAGLVTGKQVLVP